MKTFALFNTDFYQVSMMLAYILRGIESELAGFEAFVRRINPNVTTKSAYRFGGEEGLKAFICNIQGEITDPELLNTFLELITPKITHNRDEVVATVKSRWKHLIENASFQYNVAGDFTVVKPQVPVFQYWGPRWLGQLIETPVLNMINGETARNTSGKPPHDLMAYVDAVTEQAKLARHATDKPLLEGGFRRAPSFPQALIASNIAITNGWNGTSNIAAAQAGMVPYTSLGGTMAHSYVLSFEKELDAFIFWDKIFPHTTHLVDTNNVLSAVQMIIDAGIRPSDVRIDCSPIDTLCIETRKLLDKHGLHDVGIYPSGDMSPGLIRMLEQQGIPLTKTMIGTKYVNPPGFEDQESGFVYKLVQYIREDRTIFPVKNTVDKKNYPGLKNVYAKGNKIFVDCSGKLDWFGFEAYSLRKVDDEAEVIFV